MCHICNVNYIVLCILIGTCVVKVCFVACLECARSSFITIVEMLFLLLGMRVPRVFHFAFVVCFGLNVCQLAVHRTRLLFFVCFGLFLYNTVDIRLVVP